MRRGTIIFEVKEPSEDANFHKQPLQAVSRTVGEHIRSKIGQARKQIQFGARQFVDFALAIGMALSSRPNMRRGAPVVRFVKFAKF